MGRYTNFDLLHIKLANSAKQKGERGHVVTRGARIIDYELSINKPNQKEAYILH